MKAPAPEGNAGAGNENRYLTKSLTLPRVISNRQVGKLFMTTIRFLSIHSNILLFLSLHNIVLSIRCVKTQKGDH